jgi:bifunctional UDP-N-acetylglucosamine pyrophosphorylase / glucosamine-1-phosphate N-acetyltransferase
MKITAILLAAGQGTRMKSSLPKVLHPVAGKPMLWHAMNAIQQVTTEKPVVVVGHGADEVTAYLGETAQTVLQEPQLGTGHAVMQAESLLKGKTDLVIVCYADMPLLRGETLQKLVETQKQNKGTHLHADGDRRRPARIWAHHPQGRWLGGRPLWRTTLRRRAKADQRTECRRILLRRRMAVGALQRIPKNPKKGEYYLTDTR